MQQLNNIRKNIRALLITFILSDDTKNKRSFDVFI